MYRLSYLRGSIIIVDMLQYASKLLSIFVELLYEYNVDAVC